MTSLVELTFIENLNQFNLLHRLSESNKILFLYKASSDKLEDVKKFCNHGNDLGSRLLQYKKQYSQLLCPGWSK